MSQLTLQVNTGLSPYPARQKRAADLGERYPFAAQILEFYGQLAGVQGQIWQEAQKAQPSPLGLTDWEGVPGALAQITALAAKAGPEPLRSGAELLAELSWETQREVLEAYLRDVPFPELPCDEAVAFFLARATLGPIMEATDLEAGVTVDPENPGKRCPWCWGLPQCKVLQGDGEYSASCKLLCSRCARAWDYPRRTCAVCGEESLTKLALFEADEVLPHLRVDGCRTCNQYVVTVDLRRDGQAVPLVDELCALPLDLWAAEQGFSKAHPNLMGV